MAGGYTIASGEHDLPAPEAWTTERVFQDQAAIKGRSVLDSRDQVAWERILSLTPEMERRSMRLGRRANRR